MPDWTFEDRYDGIIAGIDEAGRGPWAGPVTAGAVVFLTREINPVLLHSLNDSKKLSPHKREMLFGLIENERDLGHLSFGLGWAQAAEIDEVNILQATFRAMRRAVANLPVRPDVALIDGNLPPDPFECRVQTVVKGDALSLSIAAASIVAKVSRDRFMTSLAQQYPQYGFEHHAGYGTKEHIEALQKYGISPQHRLSYRPIAALTASSEKA